MTTGEYYSSRCVNSRCDTFTCCCRKAWSEKSRKAGSWSRRNGRV